MGTHPIFESDFDCLTETMSARMRALTRMWTIRVAIARRINHYAYFDTVNAVSAANAARGLFEHNGRLIDAAALVNTHQLYSLQRHYTHAVLPAAKLNAALLGARSVGEIEGLLRHREDELLDLDLHEQQRLLEVVL